MKFSTGAGIAAMGLLIAPTAFFATGCDAADPVAAVVNGENIEESTITDYVQKFRETNGLEDDAAWAQWMVDNGRDAASVREDAIDYFVQMMVMEQDAHAKGIEISDEEVDEQLAEIKEYYGYDDEQFNEQLEAIGYTPETYRDYVRQSLLSEKLMEAVNTDTEVSDEDILAQANSYTSILNGAKEIQSIVVTDEAAANDLKARLDKGEDFATLASENSTTTDYDGWNVLLPLDQTVTSALEPMSKGDVSAVIASDDGTSFYIVKVNDVLAVDEEAGFASLDQVPEALREEFKTTVESSTASTNFDTYIQELIDGAEKTINPMPEGLPYNVSTEGVEPTTADSTDTSADQTITLDENGQVIEGEDTTTEVSVEGGDADVTVDETETAPEEGAPAEETAE